MTPQERVLQNYKNPANAGNPSWVPTHTFKLANLSCGDEIEVFLLVKESKIIDFKFNAEGCSISVASASLLSQKIIGMSIEEFQDFTLDNLIELVGIQLSNSRSKCVDLSLQAVKKALV
jgi:nitrogen fixation NifU-like protein